MKIKLLFILFLFPILNYGQVSSDFGLSFEAGISFRDIYADIEYHYSPSANLSVFIEKNRKVFGYGVSFFIMQINTRREIDGMTLFEFDSTGMIVIAGSQDAVLDIQSTNVGFNVYGSFNLNKIALKFGVLPYTEFFQTINYDIKGTTTMGTFTRNSKVKQRFQANINLGLKLDLCYKLKENLNIKLSAMQSVNHIFNNYQMTMGVAYRFIEIGASDY